MVGPWSEVGCTGTREPPVWRTGLSVVAVFFPEKFGRNMEEQFGNLRAGRHCGVELTVVRSR
jgi:hypothetical protein